MKFHAAVDETMDGEFLAFVICDEDDLFRHMKHLPSNFTHIADGAYPKFIKKEIIDGLNLDGNTWASCIRFDIPRVRKIIKQATIEKLPKGNITKKVSYRMFRVLNEVSSGYLSKNGLHLKELCFQVDNEPVRRFFRDSAIPFQKADKLHKIADCLAYANLQKWDVRGSIVERGEDYTETFIELLIKDLKSKK